MAGTCRTCGQPTPDHDDQAGDLDQQPPETSSDKMNRMLRRRSTPDPARYPGLRLPGDRSGGDAA